MLDLVEYSRIWNVIFLDGFEADASFSPLPLPLASRVRCLTYVVGSYNMCLFLILAVQLVHFLLFFLGDYYFCYSFKELSFSFVDFL